MGIYIATFIVFASVIAGMAVGVIFSNRRIRGSCGGLSAWKDELGKPMCEACADDPNKKHDCELLDEDEAPTEPAASAS
ncbi:MAG: (Na+)-NQR maturation NqrM [Planctomycetota bacterium]